MNISLASSKYKQLGIGLIELMISMLIGLFIMAGVVQMFSTTSQNAVVSAGASRIQENSRYVYTRIAEDIAQTGNLGCVSASNATRSRNEFMENLLGLSSAAGEPYDFDSIVNGDQSATGTTDPAGLVAIGTDTFRVRFVNHLFRVDLARNVEAGDTSILLDTADPDYGRLTQFQIVALANCSRASVFMITNTPTPAGEIQFGTSPIAPSSGINPGQFNTSSIINNAEGGWYGLVDGSSRAESPTYVYGGTTGSSLYFIGTSAAAGGNTCALTSGVNAGPQYCALFRRHKGINEELVEGVSNMEVFYGWTDTAGLLFYARANGAVDWGRVDRLRVKMTFNSIENVRTTGNTIATTDALIEREVERTFNLSNQL